MPLELERALLVHWKFLLPLPRWSLDEILRTTQGLLFLAEIEQETYLSERQLFSIEKGVFVVEG
jgi:hypothetical protein